MSEPVSNINKMMAQAPQIPMNFGMAVCVAGNFSRAQLEDALARAVTRYPLAGSSWIPGQPGAPTPDRAPNPIPLREKRGCADTDWQAAACAGLGTPFSMDAGTMLRVDWLRGTDFHDLVFTFNHFALDGLAGWYFVRDTLRLLADPGLSLPPQPPLPDFEQLIPARARRRLSYRLQRGLMRAMVRLGAARARRRPPKPPLPPADPGSVWSHFSLRAWELDEAHTARLAARCKTEGTTVQGAVCAAWMCAAAEARLGRRGWRRSVSSPVNLRPRLLPDHPEAFGSYVSMVKTAAACAPGRNFWDIAREVRRKLARGAASDDVFSYMLLLLDSFTALPPQDMLPMMDEFMNQPVGYDFSVTNIGRLDDLPARLNGLRVTAVHGPLVNSQPRERTVCVCTFAGRLRMSLVFCDLFLEPGLAERLGAEAVEKLIADSS